MTSFLLKDRMESTIFVLRVCLKNGADFIKWLHDGPASTFPCKVSGFVNFSDQRKEYLWFAGEFKISEFGCGADLYLGDRIVHLGSTDLAELCVRASRRPEGCAISSVITVLS